MTTVEILYHYAAPPTEQVAVALARASEVYGIRRLSFDHEARTLRVEYDATRLNAAAVTKLVRAAGLEIAPEVADALPQISAPEPDKAPAPAA
jgi:hypothetical protein